MRISHFTRWMAGGIVFLIIAAFTALHMGAFHVPAGQVLSILAGNGSPIPSAENVILHIRLPRILLSITAGAGLACAGGAFQSLFSNPLATPDTLGTANGAAFGAALGILAGMPAFGVQLTAMGFGIIAVLLVFFVTRTRSGGRNSSLIMVILAGLVISALFSALISLIKYAADPNDELPVITFWLMGSFSSVTMKSFWLGVPLISAGTAVLILMRYRINALSLSDNEARSLGINLRLTRAVVIVAASAITASTVALCGIIGWTGLLIPHISRMLFGNDNRRVLPASIVFGGIFMLIVDTAARCATQAEIPVSILTALIGAPVFIILLRKTGGIQI